MNQLRLPGPPAGGMTASPFISAMGTRPASLHTIHFTGSGSEYFRIWIVNLLLMLVTLGLYYPWAKVRKLRYFYGNTFVIGHPLGFHGNPRQMLRGFLLVSLLMVLYGVAGRVSPISGAVAGLILAALWPALLRSSLQFRLSQTSWRGLRFHFTGSLKSAYMVLLNPMLIGVGVMMLSGILMAFVPRGLGKAVVPMVLSGVMVLGSLALAPYMIWRIKRYQHAHYALGQLQTTFKATYRNVLAIFLKTGLLTLAAATGLVLVGGLLGLVLGGGQIGTRPDPRQLLSGLSMMLPVVAGYILLTQVIVAPYFSVHLQNLVWTQTGNRMVRFKSHLRWPDMAGLALKNWLLIMLTFGLYWPFAAVALARARLQAIVIHTRQDPDMLVGQARQASTNATGDLAADLVGIDVGL